MDFLAVSTTSCYFMEVNFSISLPFPEKKEGRKRKTKENNNNCSPKKNTRLGIPGWLSGLVPPSARGLILETWDRVPRQAPCMEPASPSACVSASLSLSVTIINKLKKKIIKKK